MENTLQNTAQMIMDLYYQSLKAEEDFFEIEHFVFCARAVYGKLLQNEADDAKKFAKAEQGYYVITLSQDWLISEVVSFSKNKRGEYKGTLKQLPFSFPFDQMGYSVQTVEPMEGAEMEYIRVSPEVKWQFRHMPVARKTFYYVRGQEICLVNRQQIKETEEAEVWYAPSLTGAPETAVIPMGKQLDIITYSLQLMKQAANGAVVNTTNNQNPNNLIQAELDKETLK